MKIEILRQCKNENRLFHNHLSWNVPHHHHQHGNFSSSSVRQMALLTNAYLFFTQSFRFGTFILVFPSRNHNHFISSSLHLVVLLPDVYFFFIQYFWLYGFGLYTPLTIYLGQFLRQLKFYFYFCPLVSASIFCIVFYIDFSSYFQCILGG